LEKILKDENIIELILAQFKQLSEEKLVDEIANIT
jgi:hypothetical protein